MPKRKKEPRTLGTIVKSAYQRYRRVVDPVLPAARRVIDPLSLLVAGNGALAEIVYYGTPKVQQALEYVANDLDGTWLDVIQSGEVEFGMTVKFDEKLIQGQIDLWGSGKNGQMWVVDYKTGNPAYQDKAFKQLEIYCWALRKINKIELQQTVNLAVIYPFSKMTLVRTAPLYEQTEKELRFVRE
jgi:hypothetical protein